MEIQFFETSYRGEETTPVKEEDIIRLDALARAVVIDSNRIIIFTSINPLVADIKAYTLGGGNPSPRKIKEYLHQIGCKYLTELMEQELT